MRACVDDGLGQEGFTYVLQSGAEGSVHVDSVLEYNEDPVYMRDLLLYNLTVEAQKHTTASPFTQAEIMRRAKTSASQIVRLLDASNRTKSVDQLLVLLGAMDCEVNSPCTRARATPRSAHPLDAVTERLPPRHARTSICHRKTSSRVWSFRSIPRTTPVPRDASARAAARGRACRP